jgi:hypothetical protein
MKKLILGICILTSMTSFAYTRLSSDEYLKGIFTSSATKEIMKKYYDYNNDLAVVSDRVYTEKEAEIDAINGLKNSMTEYTEKYLSKLFKNTNLSGKDFDESTIKTMANEIVNNVITNKKYTLANKVEVLEGDKTKYLILVKIPQSYLENESNKIFKERLKNLIFKLNDYYHELGK